MSTDGNANGSLGDRVEVGQLAPPLDIGRIGITRIVRFAGAGGDLNPVHYDRDFARALGNPDVFAMGMLPGSILGAFASHWLAPYRVSRLRLRFTDRVWPDERLVCGGRIVSVGNGTVATVQADLWLCTDGDAIKVSGECTAERPG